MSVFEYLLDQESKDGNFSFGVAKGQSLYISYPGYNHMNLETINQHLRSEYRLKYDFKQGVQKFDRLCGRTFVYFKDVYKNN